jgi:DNA-binding CsgD family transcriptional regulator
MSEPRVSLSELAQACYSLDGSDRVWLDGILSAMRPVLDLGLGVAAWTLRPGQLCADELPLGVDPEIGRALVHTWVTWPQDDVWRAVCGRRAHSVCERLGRTAGMDLAADGMALKQIGVSDLGVITAIEASIAGVVLAAPSRQVMKTRRDVAARLERMGAHMLSGFRLRRALTTVEAVLDPGGKLLDASNEARAPEQRDALRAAVKAFDRACSSRSASDPDGALESWQALVSGRWSLVESFESDGRRYLVARPNPPETMERTALSPLEAHALVLRAQSASYKLIGYELGLSLAAAQQLVASGCKKLGVLRETELPQLFRAHASAQLSLARSAEPAG